MTDDPSAALAFLQTRRSTPRQALTTPLPGRSSMARLLEVAARVPDHGKLEPFRFVVLGTDTRAALVDQARRYAAASGMEDATRDKGLGQLSASTRMVAVIASPKDSAKIPQIEQTLTAGAACLSLVNAALASGWGACWLSGWIAHERGFAAPAFGLADHEWVAGLVHIGTATSRAPERPRPDMDAITTWLP